MELFIVTLASVVIGVAAYFLAPSRNLLGPAFIPGLAGALGAASWTSLAWIGAITDGAWLAFSSPWIWMLSIGLALALALTLALTIGPARRSSDTDLFERLSHAGSDLLR